MENKETQLPPSENAFFDVLPQPAEVSPFKVLATLALCVLGGYFFVSMVVLGVGKMGFGYDYSALQAILSGDVKPEHSNFLRFALISQHLFLFLLPALVCSWLYYRPRVAQTLALDRPTTLWAVILGMTFLVVSSGFVQYSYQLNRALPLPNWAISSEENVQKTLEIIFSLKGFGGILLNVLMVAAMPALSEEILFRGVIQRQLARIVTNPHIHVWLTAFVFSAIHFQFQGFLPRLFLGSMLGYLLVWSRSLWVPIAAHFFYNGAQVVGLYALNMPMDEVKKLEQNNDIHWTIAGVSLMLTLMLGKYMRENLSKEQDV